MVVLIKTLLLCITFATFTINRCRSELIQSMYLVLYGPNDIEYTDVLIRKVNDNLTLFCELRGDGVEAAVPRHYMWNYVPATNTSDIGDNSPFSVVPSGVTVRSMLLKQGLTLSDSGYYWCSAPPFSVTKYILVQTKGPKHCMRGSFHCGSRCVLPAYVCDGYRDCELGEDEARPHCPQRLCDRSDRLNCSSGRCIPATCCRGGGTSTCHTHQCCAENAQLLLDSGMVESEEFPATFDDRRAPDEYGLIQSTIYTVTACALIFMIAVVFLVSAICKMHMKRAALRTYAHAHPHADRHYNTLHYAQRHRFPPCYEASRLLEQERAPSPSTAAAASPNSQQCGQESGAPGEAAGACAGAGNSDDNQSSSRFALTTLSAMFTPVYRQVPTQCCDVEMTDVRSASLNSSPTRSRTRTRLDNYRSPTYCDLNTDLYFANPELQETSRDLNMVTPVEFYRRRTREQRPLTLQLGRFQLSIPRFGRRSSEPRPDTPNVAEINIDDLDFVRLNSNETYTLNGGTIRLLGASFENYPPGRGGGGGNRPPPYNEAVRYKLCGPGPGPGPPPEYLSRDALDSSTDGARVNNNPDEDATNNIEMPPRYEDLTAPTPTDPNANSINNSVLNNDSLNVANNIATVVTENSVLNNDSLTVANNATTVVAENSVLNNGNAALANTDVADNNNSMNTHACVTDNINSVIDNLPAIDSDENANGTVYNTVLNN